MGLTFSPVRQPVDRLCQQDRRFSEQIRLRLPLPHHTDHAAEPGCGEHCHCQAGRFYVLRRRVVHQRHAFRRLGRHAVRRHQQLRLQRRRRPNHQPRARQGDRQLQRPREQHHLVPWSSRLRPVLEHASLFCPQFQQRDPARPRRRGGAVAFERTDWTDRSRFFKSGVECRGRSVETAWHTGGAVTSEYPFTTLILVANHGLRVRLQ